MDNLVLIRVAAAYGRSLGDGVVRELREEPGLRFRLVLAAGERPRSVLFGLDPEEPWTGRPAGRAARGKPSPGPFAAAVGRALHGGVLRGVEKAPADRRVAFRFASGDRLVADLRPRRPNLLLVDAAGVVVAARRSVRGCRAGELYAPEGLPPRRVDPFGASVERIAAGLREGLREGGTPRDALLRTFVGLGSSAADLLAREAREAGVDLAGVIRERLDRLARGDADPVLETLDEDPLEAATRGTLDPETLALLPWTPPWPAPAGRRRIALDDAAATAGLFHAAREIAREDRRRFASLRSVLEREIYRLADVALRVEDDAASFEDPERFRRWGEALLAGLSLVRRVGDHVLVPDPYDPDGVGLSVPVRPGEAPSAAATRHFTMHRRARRGIERARARRESVAERRKRLVALRDAHAAAGPAAAEALERAMQAEGIPVGLDTRPGARRVGVEPARLEGVRMFLSRAGDMVFVGKSGPDNQRLTFRIAAPEDFWLHARGVPGAHVVVRNPRRAPSPPPATLEEAAAAAAYFSEAREQPAVDVQWTRRKYVRKLRGAPPGTVTVKRSATVRVRPRRPAALESEV